MLNRKKKHFFSYIFIKTNWPSKFKNNYRDQKLSKTVWLFKDKDRKSDNIYLQVLINLFFWDKTDKIIWNFQNEK